ncbi:UNVERIFIED_CONTAM: hypothetical protein GTU68_031871 [Idotea baltica]|nr:hypothetical protein [Idotea baltica]
MKIYTKTGDKGQTSLFGGTRVPKYHLRIEAYGTVDELNAYIGLLKDQKNSEQTVSSLLKIQNDLFTLGAMLATPPEKETLKNGKDRLNYLESQIDVMQLSLPQLTHFILPGGHQTVSFCHISRCICRRAERLATELNDNTPIDEHIIMYLNRLSDYLFVLARKLTYDNHVEEIPWQPSKK